mmetsp:Transcript_2712/g.4207  ORF Transcript_2712/g.4207 Transcript_2712/m.4207 type:complete len:123 (-) Transcript_2712:173-541(-)
MSSDEFKQEFAQFGLKFAKDLVNGEFDSADSMLCSELDASVTGKGGLKKRYDAMVAYGDGPATSVEVMNVMDSSAYPKRQSGDIGWVYVSIMGDGFSEAVAVIVCNDGGGEMKIRHIEWGRP